MSTNYTFNKYGSEGTFNSDPHYKIGFKKESFSTRGMGVGFASKADRFNTGSDALLTKHDTVKKMAFHVT